MGALAARPATRVAFGSARRSRGAAFYNNITVPAAGAQSYASWDDEISDLFEKIGKLQEAATLPAVGEDLDEINTLLGRLPADLQAVRQRGYVHEAQLEGQINTLAERWEGLYQQVADALYNQQVELVEAANRLLDNVDRLYDRGVDRGTVNSCWAGVRALQSRIEAAHKNLSGMYDDYGDQLEQIETSIDRVEWMLDQVEAAKFQLLQSEAPIRAGSARWARQGEDEGPKGILYLTDQRLLFEQKEEVTTEKFLFIKMKSETVHEFLFEAPVNSIEEVKVGKERRGFLRMGKVELLEFRFDHTAQYNSALFHLLSDKTQEWETLIGRVRSGGIDRARTEQSAAEVEALAEAQSEIPTNCPSCSAPLDQNIVRGMTSITCQYCGAVVRI